MVPLLDILSLASSSDLQHVYLALEYVFSYIVIDFFPFTGSIALAVVSSLFPRCFNKYIIPPVDSFKWATMPLIQNWVARQAREIIILRNMI